jgi:hypothetical protein
MQNKKVEEQIKQLVVARLQTLPPDASVSIGSEGSFTRDELINHVKKNDKFGKKITEVELEYLRMLKEGSIYAQNSSGH